MQEQVRKIRNVRKAVLTVGTGEDASCPLRPELPPRWKVVKNRIPIFWCLNENKWILKANTNIFPSFIRYLYRNWPKQLGLGQVSKGSVGEWRYFRGTDCVSPFRFEHLQSCHPGLIGNQPNKNNFASPPRISVTASPCVSKNEESDYFAPTQLSLWGMENISAAGWVLTLGGIWQIFNYYLVNPPRPLVNRGCLSAFFLDG